MAVNLLFGRKAAKVGILQLDATLSESHQYDNEISEFPVESGSNISDHIKQNPERITINGFITNTPVEVITENVSNVIQTSPGEAEVRSSERTGTSNRVELAQDALLRISGRKIQGANQEPEIIDIITGLRVYTGMAMESLEIPRDASTGQTLRFTATFIKILTVESETVLIPNAIPAIVDKAQSKVDKGKQTVQEPTAQQSALSRLASSLFKTAKRSFN